jgi:hypothetical protein
MYNMDNLIISFTDEFRVLLIYNFVISEGLYTLDSLNDEIIRLLQVSGGQTNPPLISFNSNSARNIFRFMFDNYFFDKMESSTKPL